MKNILAIVAIALIATACQKPPPTQILVPVNFANRAPYRINVAQINIVENFKSPAVAPNVEHQFPTPPAAGVKQWATKRLQAVGAGGVMEITIDDASVKEVPLPKKDGIEGFFTDDQSERYNGVLHVTMRLYDGVNAIAVANAEVSVARSRTINEKASVVDRERLYNNLTQDMLTQFDVESDVRLRQFFSAYLR